jgi:hypothetical protein
MPQGIESCVNLARIHRSRTGNVSRFTLSDISARALAAPRR